MWMLELQVRTLIVEMITMAAGDQLDRQLEEQIWDRVH